MVVQGAVSGYGWPEISTGSPAHRKYGRGNQGLDAVPSADIVADDVFGDNTRVSGKAFQPLVPSDLCVGAVYRVRRCIATSRFRSPVSYQTT